MNGLKCVMLTMVTQYNNNKFYKMQENSNNTFTATYGRIGLTQTNVTYPMSDWDKKYYEKIQKGYTNQTYLYEKDIVKKIQCKKKTYKSIINKLMFTLSTYAQTFIRKNYTVDFKTITPSMVEVATTMIDKLGRFVNNGSSDVEDFNEVLLELFMVLPRVMGNTKSFIAQTEKDFVPIYEREKYFCEQIAGSVTNMKSKTNETLDVSDISKKFKLKAWKCNKEQEEEIKTLMGSNRHKFVAAWRVENEAQRKLFDEYVEKNKITKIKKLWHGSRNENWFNILCSGLLLNPSAIRTGAMFGHGIYFSQDFDKSAGYTSIKNSRWANGDDTTAYLAIMDVAYGEALNVYSYEHHNYTSYNEKEIKSLGKNCLHAHGNNSMLKRDEIVVYNQNASSIRYLVQIDVK